VEAALRAEHSGARSPSEAFGGADFLDAVSGVGPSGSLTWRRALGDGR
jgi:hypothetical protein